MEYILDLPIELQCKILSGPMTLQEYLIIRRISLELSFSVNACLEYLISNGDIGKLNISTILDMKRIKIIPPEYPIILYSKESISDLAKHPTLREATVDVSFVRTTAEFFRLIVEFFYYYDTFGNTCQDCQERYNFIFLLDPEMNYYIQVKEGSIIMHNIPETIEVESFYEDLLKKVPICNYIGTATIGLASLPCLNKIYIHFVEEDYNIAVIGWFANNILQSKAIEDYVIYSKDKTDQYLGFIQDLILLLKNDNKIYPRIKSFFTINIEDILNIEKIFPNLISIWISLASLVSLRDRFTYPEEYERNILSWVSIFDKYSTIVLVNDLTGPFDETTYLELVPKELHNKISFIESDQILL